MRLPSHPGHLENQTTFTANCSVLRYTILDYGMMLLVIGTIMLSAQMSKVRMFKFSTWFTFDVSFCYVWGISLNLEITTLYELIIFPHYICCDNNLPKKCVQMNFIVINGTCFIFKGWTWLSSTSTWKWTGLMHRDTAENITQTWPVWETYRRTRRSWRSKFKDSTPGSVFSEAPGCGQMETRPRFPFGEQESLLSMKIVQWQTLKILGSGRIRTVLTREHLSAIKVITSW